LKVTEPSSIPYRTPSDPISIPYRTHPAWSLVRNFSPARILASSTGAAPRQRPARCRIVRNVSTAVPLPANRGCALQLVGQRPGGARRGQHVVARFLVLKSRTAPAMEDDTAAQEPIKELEILIMAMREVRVQPAWRVPSRCGARGAHRMRANVSARSGDKGQGAAKRVRRHRQVARRSPQLAKPAE
jgi:hypothetical protein